MLSRSVALSRGLLRQGCLPQPQIQSRRSLPSRNFRKDLFELNNTCKELTSMIGSQIAIRNLHTSSHQLAKKSSRKPSASAAPNADADKKKKKLPLFSLERLGVIKSAFWRLLESVRTLGKRIVKTYMKAENFVRRLPFMSNFIKKRGITQEEIEERFGKAQLVDVNTGVAVHYKFEPRDAWEWVQSLIAWLFVAACLVVIGYCGYKFFIEPMFRVAEFDLINTAINECFETLSKNDKIMGKLGGQMMTDDKLMKMDTSTRIGEMRLTMPLFGAPPKYGLAEFVFYRTYQSGETFYRIVKARAIFPDGTVIPLEPPKKSLSLKGLSEELMAQQEENKGKKGSGSSGSGSGGLLGRLGGQATAQ